MYLKKVAAVVGAGIVLAAAVPTFVDAAQQFQGVIVQNTDAEPVRSQEANLFTRFVRATSNGCVDVDLPAGRVVIDHVNGGFNIESDAYLVVWAAALGGPQQSIGRTNAVIPLEASASFVPDGIETVHSLESALLIEDGFVAEVGTFFRDEDDPVTLCGSDADESVSSSGAFAISGRVLQ